VRLEIPCQIAVATVRQKFGCHGATASNV
jgi:hypothetical protein